MVSAGSYVQQQQQARADFRGQRPLLCPPFAPPPRAPLPFCMQHARSSFRCLRCAEARKLKGPKPPLKFAQKVVVSPNDEASFGNKTSADSTFIVQSERVPVVLDSNGRARPAQLLSVCLDGEGTVWVGVAQMWSYQELSKMNNSVPPSNLPADGVDKTHEMFEDAVSTYMRAERIVSHCYVLACTKEEFHARRKSGDFPQKSGRRPVKFARFVADSRAPCAIRAPRVLDSSKPVAAAAEKNSSAANNSEVLFDIIVS